MEELVDSLLLIVMVKHGVDALRVKPAFSLRRCTFHECSHYGHVWDPAGRVRLTYAADEDAASGADAQQHDYSLAYPLGIEPAPPPPFQEVSVPKLNERISAPSACVMT